MKRCLVGSALSCVACLPLVFGASREPVLPETILERALDRGCSLVVAEILSVRREGEVCYYKSRIVRTIVAGDSEKEEVQSPRDLSAGASYGSALKPGSCYALFVRRDCPYDFAWAFRDDAVEVDPSDKEAIHALSEAADRVYAKTAILRFRRANLWRRVEPPDLPDGLASLCKQFREQPGRRTEIGRKIAESDLGSRIDDLVPGSSIRAYLPPKISCSRLHILSLLGEPTWRNGWTYSWRCDDLVHPQEGGSDTGVLSVTFDRSETAVRVLFDMQERSKWIRPSRPADRLAELDGDPAGVARRFQESLKNSDWRQALSLCSQPVRAKAGQFDSAATFFSRLVPVKEIVSRPFNPHLFSSRDGRVVKMSDEVSLRVGEDEWWPQWPWSLVRADTGWLVDFELLSLDDFRQKSQVVHEMQDGRGRTEPGEFEKAVKYVLTPLSESFVIGQPMLFRLEMKNTGDKAFGCGRTDVMVNDPMLVTGPDGGILPYVDTSYQTAWRSDAILPGETIVLVDKYDVTTQYRILRAGRCTFCFKSSNRRSNVCEMEVQPGTPPEMEQIVDKLLPVRPAGWRWTRSLTPPWGLKDGASKVLHVTLIGKPGGKGNDYGMTLLILMGGDLAETDPWLREWYDFWGVSPWGPVYARVNQADELWPSYKGDIVKALEIKVP
jgi:hypothetical protein